jgi:uncharacterized protein (DUF849 family)
MILAVAPNGARRDKRDHAMLPMTVEEIASEARDCFEAGAAMLHLHVRDADGGHSIDPARYEETIAAIRKTAGPDLVIQITTEAAGRFVRDEQIATAMAVQADSISLAVREICPTSSEETSSGDLYRALSAKGVLAQHIVYDVADLARLSELRAKDVIPEPRPFVQLVLGRYGERRVGGPRDLLAFLSVLENSDLAWSVCCFGFWETMAIAAAAAYGGHARIGFENNLTAVDGTAAASNAQRVRECAAIIAATGRPLADGSFIRSNGLGQRQPI